jgi:vacuolar protein sorting-associated protein 52
MESEIEEKGVDSIVIKDGEIESLVRHFGSTWKSGIAHMAKSINTYFQNLKNGMSILKLCLTQLLLYNTRFQDIIKKIYQNKPIPFSKELVPIQQVLYEIKKYSQ